MWSIIIITIILSAVFISVLRFLSLSDNTKENEDFDIEFGKKSIRDSNTYSLVISAGIAVAFIIYLLFF